MKRRILSLLCAWAIITAGLAVPAARAQVGQQTNPTTGTLTSQDSGTCSQSAANATSNVIQQLSPNASTTIVTLAGTFSATATIRLSANGGANWTTSTTASAVGTTSISTNGYTHICVDLTTYASGSVLVTINTGLLQVQSVVSGGTSSGNGTAAGAANGRVILDPTCAVTNLNNCYFAYADVHYAYNATFSFTAGSSAVVTCSTCAFTSADVGKSMQATTWTNFATSENATTTMALTTITALNSTTTVTVASASGSSTGTGILIWGHDDTTAINAAIAAASTANNCLTVQLPGGSMFVSAPIGVTTPTCMNGWSNPTTHYVSIIGYSGGNTSIFVPTTTFNVSTCPGGGTGGFFFTFTGVTVQNVAIIGWGVNPGGTVNCSIIATQTDATYQNITISSWLATSAGSTGLTFTVNTGAHVYYNLSVGCAGASSVVVNGNARNISDSFVDTCTNAPAVLVNSGGQWSGDTDDFENDGNTSTVLVNNSGYFVERRGNTSPATGGTNNNTLFSGQSGSYTELDQMAALANTANASSEILGLASGATAALLGNSSLNGGSTGCAIFLASTTAILKDLGGNVIGSNCAISGAGVKQIFTSASITGTPLATGGVGLTSGWGASTVASVSATSDSHKGRFTITGAVGAASPVLTLTFPTPYWAPPSSCALYETGASDIATLTNPIPATATTTSIAWTFTGTPAAVTYVFDYECGP